MHSLGKASERGSGLFATTVEATLAFTKISAFDACLETLAVFLLTSTLLAIASFVVLLCILGDLSFECSRVLISNLFDHSSPFFFIFRRVSTTNTVTVISTDPSCCKTLAIEF